MVQKVLQPFAPKTPSKNLKKRFSKSFFLIPLKSPRSKKRGNTSAKRQNQKDLEFLFVCVICDFYGDTIYALSNLICAICHLEILLRNALKLLYRFIDLS